MISDLAKAFESLQLLAYRDIGGVLTIGYGHTGKDVYEGLIWTEDQADAHLADDIADVEALLQTYSPGPFVPGALTALTDFVFNIGIGAYRNSTLRKLVDSQQWIQVKQELLKWDHVGGVVVDGLYRRRKAEADLIQGA